MGFHWQESFPSSSSACLGSLRSKLSQSCSLKSEKPCVCVSMCVCLCVRAWCNAILHSSLDLSQDIKSNPLGFVSISLHCLCTPAQSTVCAPGIPTPGPDRDAGSKTSFSKWFYASSLSFYLCIFCACVLSRVRLFAIPWTVAHQAPLSMGFSRQGCWSELSCSPPEELPDPRIGPASLWSAAPAGGFFATAPPGKPPSLTEDPQALDAHHSPQHSLSLSCSSWNRYMSLWHLLTLLATWWPQSPGCRPKPPFLPHTDSLLKILGEHINSTQ